MEDAARQAIMTGAWQAASSAVLGGVRPGIA
jgi:hypothetical protein